MPYFNREGYQLYFHHAGKGQPVVFIHGYLGSSQGHWKFQLNDHTLSSQFQFIAPDLRGFGNSRSKKIIETHKNTENIADIRHLLKQHLGIVKPVLVGYSIGGTLALNYAIQFPQDVKGIVLVSPRPFLNKSTRTWGAFMSKEKRSGKNKSLLSASLWIFIKRLQKLIQLLEIFLKRRQKEYLEYLNSLLQLKIPLLLIYGDRDTVNPKVSYEILKEYLPGVKVIEYKGDHGIQHEHPNVFNRILLQFLNKITYPVTRKPR